MILAKDCALHPLATINFEEARTGPLLGATALCPERWSTASLEGKGPKSNSCMVARWIGSTGVVGLWTSGEGLYSLQVTVMLLPLEQEYLGME